MLIKFFKFLLQYRLTRSLFINVWLPIVRAVAWWYENVSLPWQSMAFDFVYVPFRRWFGHRVGWWIATAVEYVTGAFLLDFPAWLIAGGYLQAKWYLEDSRRI